MNAEKRTIDDVLSLIDFIFGLFFLVMGVFFAVEVRRGRDFIPAAVVSLYVIVLLFACYRGKKWSRLAKALLLTPTVVVFLAAFLLGPIR